MTPVTTPTSQAHNEMAVLDENHEATAAGKIDLKNGDVLDGMNGALAEVTFEPTLTPYIAWEKVIKVLATYHVFMPKTFLEGSHGNHVAPVFQFGEKMGMTDDGVVKTHTDTDLFLYFEWLENEEGQFEIFAEVVNEEELAEILKDYDDEEEGPEEMNESNKDPVSGVYNMIAKTFRGVGRTIKMKKNPDPGKANVGVYGKKAKEHYDKQTDNVKAKINLHLREPSDADVHTQYKRAVKLAGSKTDEAFETELAKGAKDEKQEHGMSNKEAVKTAKDHLKKDKKYYTKLDKIGLEEMSKSKEWSKEDIKKYMDNHIQKDWKKKPKLPYPKKAKEETINEVSKGLVKRYIEKANQDRDRADIVHHYTGDKKAQKKRNKRADGLQNAFRKMGKPLGWDSGKAKVLAKEETINEVSKKVLGSYIKKASNDVATKSAAVGRYADRANKARDKMKKGDYSDWQQGKKDDEFADKMFKKSWKRRQGIAKAVDRLQEASVTTASKKAVKGTKWKVKSRNPDSEGSEVELRQGKRVKMSGYYDRNAGDFVMGPTKKNKPDWSKKDKSYASGKDILKTVKEEDAEEACWIHPQGNASQI